MKHLPLLLLLACGKGGDDSGATVDGEACGDPDASGTDTGNIPDLNGDWTSMFAQDFFEEACSADNLTQTSETWIGSFQVSGSYVNGFQLLFGDNPDERFLGALDPFGGVTFTGIHQHSAGAMYANFSGLVYHDQYTDRDVIEGAATLGLDADGDARIDCLAKGSWKAFKSGS